MNKRRILLPTFLSIAFLAVFLLSSKPVHAISFEDIITGAKSFFTGGKKEEITVEPNIELVSNGDLNKNGQIDSGDTIKYTFTITNNSDGTYKTSRLETKVSTDSINSISNIKGIVSLDISKKTIVIPNLTITPKQYRKISFEAKVNYFKDENKTLASEAELVDDKNKTLFKAAKKEVVAKKMDEEKFNKILHITK